MRPSIRQMGYVGSQFCPSPWLRLQFRRNFSHPVQAEGEEALKQILEFLKIFGYKKSFYAAK
ncbi:hypothetical protein X927_03210 [Petrotoga mexicana DSM 14811]|uniref:Uncharacterized protein n=1 Tax=Petrotoga mexicana DSM 14811 TaxID=1122954 RepID=A0A2K1PCJ4_9BACT|nr:hypothetical protein X927_03210 [Petrotoga mexicana DSM 14811]